MKLIKRKAFSLVEISVVVIIIGFLIVGISLAIDMFPEASLKGARNLSKLSRVSRIEDLTLWLDATSSEAFDKEKDDNSKISIWKDTNTGSASSISSISPSENLYPSYSLSAINKLPAVSFNSSVGNCITVSNQSFINSSEDFTLYLIFNPKTLNNGVIIEKNNNTATTFPFSLELFSGFYKFSIKNSTTTISVTGARQPKINTPNLIRLSRIKGSQIEITIDGISAIQSDTLTSSTLNNADLSIGCRNGNTPTNFINGDIGETAFFNRNINLKDKSDIEEYLYKKWKINKFEEASSSKTCSASEGIGYSAKSQLLDSGTFPCDAGYTGTINYTCPSSGGTATITSGSCTANTCSVSAGIGYTAKTLLPVGSASFSCDTGYTGTINYTCPSSGGTISGTGSCTAITCNVPSTVNASQATVGFSTTPTTTGLSCKTGFTGSPNYTCTGETIPGTYTAGGTPCVAEVITCNVPSTVNANQASVDLSSTPTSTGLTCKAGFFGSPKYTCIGTSSPASYTADGIPCAPIKCYAIDMVGFRGTNYLNYVSSSGFETMEAWSNLFRIYSSVANLPSVNRLKLYDVYHGPLNYTSSSSSSIINFTSIDRSNFSKTSYPSFFRYQGAPYDLYNIKGNHVLTKYARILDYGINSFTCDSGYTGNLTYNCQTDASTLSPASGTCAANSCTVSAGIGYNQQSKSGSGTFSCDIPGYNGTISYTCATNGGTVAGTGSCALNTCTVSAGTGYTQQANKLGSGTFPCNVAGYTGTISYTCTTNGGTVAGTGSCTANSCTVSAGIGYNQQSKTGVGTFLCDVAGYSGTISYTCTTNGGTVTGTGSCNVITCTTPASNGYLAQSSLAYKTAGSPGTITCNQPGYTGSVSYTCTSIGLASITGSCTANSCTVSAGTGYNQQSRSGSGSFPCDLANYTGAISYACTSNGGTFAGTGTCYSTSAVTSISDLILWYDATSLNAFNPASPILNTGILNWYNKAPNNLNAFNAYSPSGNVPVFYPSGIKGLPSLYFNGANKFMDVASGYDGGARIQTIFVVWQPVARDNVYIVRKMGGNDAGFTIEDNIGGASYYTRLSCCNGSTTFIVGPGNQGTVGRADVLSVSISVVASSNGTDWGNPSSSTNLSKLRMWVNGNPGSILNFNTNEYVANIALGSYPFKIAGGSLNGMVGEVIIYNKWLTDTERDAVTSYLMAKWK
jgi:hypothetical protein